MTLATPIPGIWIAATREQFQVPACREAIALLACCSDGLDCNTVMDSYNWHSFLGDAWIIFPFLLGMLVYKLLNGISFPFKYDRLPDKGDDDYFGDSESP